MSVRRLFKRYKNVRIIQQYNTKKPKDLLHEFGSTRWLFVMAIIGVLTFGAAIAGEGSVFNGNNNSELSVAGDRHPQAQTRTGASGALDFNDDNDDEDTEDTNTQENLQASQDNQSTQSVNADVDIDVDDPQNASTVIHDDGTLEHTYESDDGKTKVNIKVRGDADTDTDIDIDTNSQSFNFESDSQTNERRNPHNWR